MTSEQIMTIVEREREKKGLKKYQVAEMAGVGHNTYYNYKNGFFPTLITLERLLKPLGLELILRRTTHEKHDNE